MKFVKFNGREGHFAEKVSPETPNAVQVEGGNGAIRHELQTDKFENIRLAEVKTVEDTDVKGQPRLNVVARFDQKDSPELLQVTFNANSVTTAKMLGAFHAADIDKPVTLKGELLKAGEQPKGFDKPLEKDMVALNMFQGGHYVRPDIEIPQAENLQATLPDGTTMGVRSTAKRKEFVVSQVEALQARLERSREASIAADPSPIVSDTKVSGRLRGVSVDPENPEGRVLHMTRAGQDIRVQVPAKDLESVAPELKPGVPFRVSRGDEGVKVERIVRAQGQEQSLGR
ncbi:MAG: hypothetical protein M0T84_07250 [Betaproteobacteria bacterium]|nr:hypothetical protein [Betaproteobacteria bacterium]